MVGIIDLENENDTDTIVDNVIEVLRGLKVALCF